MKKKNTKKNRRGFEVLKGRGRRFSFRSVMQALVFYALLLLALVVIVQLGYHWLGDQFLAWRLQVVDAEPGSMQQETTVTGMVTRSEEVIRAPAAGMVLSLAPSGERLPAGSELATLGVLSREKMEAMQGSEEVEADESLKEQLLEYWQDTFSAENQNGGQTGEDENGDLPDQEIPGPETENDGPGEERIELPGDDVFEELIVIRSEQAGFVSHYFDGLETYEGPFYLSDQGSEAVSPHGFFIDAGDLVSAGEPVIKMVDNWQWHFSIVLPLHPGKVIAGLERIDIEFQFAPSQPVSARRYSYEIDEAAEEVRISYLIDRQLAGFDQARQAQASLLYSRLQGIIVPEEALFEKDNEPGVYLNQGGRVVFQPVTVIGRQEEKVLVEGLAPYSRVISRPDLVEEGQRLN